MSDETPGQDRDSGPRAETDADRADSRAQFRENIQAAWQTQPVFRLLVILLPILAVGAIALGLFGGGEDSAPTSQVPPGAATQDVPGGGSLTPRMEDAILTEDERRLREALQQNETFIPTPIDRGSELPGGEEQIFEADDPLRYFRDRLREQERQAQAANRQVQQAQPQQQVVAPPQNTEAMRRQMETLLRGWGPQEFQTFRVSESAFSEPPEAEAAAQAAAAGRQAPGPAIIEAGTVNYGVLLTEANSLVPGPILASIASGPLRGGRAIGSFQATEDYLVISFDRIILDGQEYDVDAVALDPDTTLAGVATSVDRKYFQRIILPAAAAFLAGTAEAITQTENRVIVVEDTVIEDQPDLDTREELAAGAAEAARTVADILEEQGEDVEPEIVVAKGTPLGIFFTAAVRPPEDAAALAGDAQPRLEEAAETE